MAPRRFQRVPGGPPSSGVEDRRVENKGLVSAVPETGDDFLRVARREKRMVAPFAPMNFHSHGLTPFEGIMKPRQ